MDLVIADIIEETKDVRTFYLQPANGSSLTYRPGQFLTFSLTIAGREQRRSYSLSSTPGIDPLPSITVKRVDNGYFSRWLIDRARQGDILQSIGEATGIFRLPDDLAPYRAIWLFAAGIGITPLFSLLKELLFHTTVPRVVLLYSNKSRDQTAFLQSLEALQQQFPGRLQLTHLWGNTQDLRRARLSKESFPLLLQEVLTDNPQQVLSYLCGPASYMWLVQMLLQDARVPPAAVRREAFVVNTEVPHRLPTDKTPRRVSIELPGGNYSFINAYPQSILDSARSAGIALPYSCNAGQCGSCTAICREGKVWMSYNEVLTDHDIAYGRVLTCTGHAVDGDVALSYKG
jgi:ring-1,2-phenylacetyl-CoA epoxidase subunit PaaE